MSIEGQPCFELKDIINRIQPLDLLFLKGTDFVNEAVRVNEDKSYSNDEFSHVVLVINSELCPFLSHLIPERLYVWQSVSIGGQSGVEVRDLEEMVTSYCGTEDCSVAWGQLKNNPWSTLSEVKGITIVQDDRIRLE